MKKSLTPCACVDFGDWKLSPSHSPQSLPVQLRSCLVLNHFFEETDRLNCFKLFGKETTFTACILCSLLGACPRLERIEVHIGISDYFVNVEDDISKRKYERIVKKLTVSKHLLNNSSINGHHNRLTTLGTLSSAANEFGECQRHNSSKPFVKRFQRHQFPLERTLFPQDTDNDESS